MEQQKEALRAKYVKLEIIDPPDGQVRMDIPDRQIFELAESMKEVGQIQAILITPVDKRFEVVVGHRRYLAAKKLKWTEIRAEIKEIDRKEVALLRATENLQREGLSPIEEAAIYVDLFDTQGMTEKMIADKMGKTKTHIRRRMSLLRLDTEIQKAIHSRKVTVEVGIILGKIEEKKELYRYLEMAVENGVTARVANMWIDDLRKSIQYINNREEISTPQEETLNSDKYYTPCQICEGPMEYRDICVVKMCKECFKKILSVLREGGE